MIILIYNSTEQRLFIRKDQGADKHSYLPMEETSVEVKMTEIFNINRYNANTDETLYLDL